MKTRGRTAVIRAARKGAVPLFAVACLAGAVAVTFTLTVAAQERERTNIPDRYKWNLTDIYQTETAWRTAKDRLALDIRELGQFQGKLGSSPQVLADALDKMFGFDKELSRLSAYASLLADQDTRDSRHEGMKQEISALASAYSAQAAFIRPEILKVDQATRDRFVSTVAHELGHTMQSHFSNKAQPYPLARRRAAI